MLVLVETLKAWVLLLLLVVGLVAVAAVVVAVEGQG
jgi:hypothetical protein